MSTTNIVTYKGFNIEATTFSKELTSIEVIGNYTGQYDQMEIENDSRCHKITADITQSKRNNNLRMRVHLQDANWIYMGIDDRDVYKSIDECIQWIKHCIDTLILSKV